MKTRFTLAIVAASLTMGNIATAEKAVINFNFSEAPLQYVVPLYEQVVRRTVTVEDGDYPVITLQPTNRLSVTEVIILLESHFRSNGIAVTKSGDGVTISPDSENMPTKVPRVPYSRISVRRSGHDRPALEIHRDTSRRDNALQQLPDDSFLIKLLEDQMEEIRKSLPPVPVIRSDYDKDFQPDN